MSKESCQSLINILEELQGTESLYEGAYFQDEIERFVSLLLILCRLILKEKESLRTTQNAIDEATKIKKSQIRPKSKEKKRKSSKVFWQKQFFVVSLNWLFSPKDQIQKFLLKKKS